MNRLKFLIEFVLLIIALQISYAREDTLHKGNETVNVAISNESDDKLLLMEQQRIADSLREKELAAQLSLIRIQDNIQKERFLRQLQIIEEKERTYKKAIIDSITKTAKGYPVLGPRGDTLFQLYSKIGAITPKNRAINSTKRIRNLFDDHFLKPDSIMVVQAENTCDVVYGETIIISISETDALWYNKDVAELADGIKESIRNSILEAKKANNGYTVLLRAALVFLIIGIAWYVFKLIGKGYARLMDFIEQNKSKWIRDLSYRDYIFLSSEQEFRILLLVVKAFRWIVYGLLLYITIPVLFSIFPFSRDWADTLFQLIWTPFRSVFLAVWDYLPNLFSILVIYFVMRYFIRFVKYIFSEIESEKLKIAGFHTDWAMPTYSIVRFLLYAFMFIMIFPYLPGSDSPVFKGVSIFVGILFSLGSTSAIANMVAGLVITYMRPFKIGNRIKIGEITGDVIEKTLLVTRIMTIKNEVVTIPNSAILSGNTVNYSSEAGDRGLIIHTTVTIDYDVPWRNIHQALIDAALRTGLILKEPPPFVLQTSLDDFYVSYQINAYIRDVNKQAFIYSELHKNIQDVCNERQIEIRSPHYRAVRSGNKTSIPSP